MFLNSSVKNHAFIQKQFMAYGNIAIEKLNPIIFKQDVLHKTLPFANNSNVA